MNENRTDKKQFTKSRLVKELSWACELPQTKIKAMLETLVEIARREARNTFVLPGICKLEVVRRKPRKVRNPRTGETFMLPERDALRISAPRSLKLACAKAVEQQPVAAEPAAQEPTTPQPEKEDSVTQPPVDPNALISFRCPRCRQEVEATGDMVGFETECPTCGNPIKVPAQSEPGTVHGAAVNGDETLVRHAKTVSSHEAESISPEKLKGLTIRINVDELGLSGLQKADEDPSSEQMVSFICTACQQEIEASRDMIGETTACPNCGAPLVVPAESASNTLHDTSHEIDPKVMQAMKGRTMRIDMSEDF